MFGVWGLGRLGFWDVWGFRGLEFRGINGIGFSG